MGTIISTVAGFTNFPATPPAGWPANLTWPGGLSPSSARTITMSDADYQKMIVWVANQQNAALFGAGPAPVAVTGGQLIFAALQTWINGVTAAVQQFFTVPATPPTPISMA